jgi:hypothetical protein
MAGSQTESRGQLQGASAAVLRQAAGRKKISRRRDGADVMLRHG